MYNCFFCERNFVDLTILKMHVRNQHASIYEKIVCKQDGCMRTFSSLKAIYKHISIKHLKLDVIVNEIVGNDGNLPLDIQTQNEPNDFDESASITLNEEREEEKFELEFILNLFNSLHFTRSDVFKIVDLTQELLKFKLNNEEDNSFKDLDSESKLIAVMKRENLCSEPTEIVLGYKQKNVKSGGKIIRKMVKISGQIFNIKKTFGIVLQSKIVRQIVSNYMSVNNDFLADYKDGSKYKDLNSNKLPFVIFYDEIETGNPLGSHKGVHKIGAFYISLRCFPTHYYSKLSHIYPLMFIPSIGTKYRDVALERLKDEINHVLKEGVVIEGLQFNFVFAGFIGDNLGLHQIFGFSEGFTARFPCRFCKINKEDLQNQYCSNSELLRTRLNYENDLELNNLSQTGISRYSILNEIDGYHVVENSFVDVMHDFAEGVGNYGITCVLQFYVNNSTLTLDMVNEKLRSFSFGNSCNKPPVIKENYLLKDQLPYSAAEVINLITFFGMLFANYIDVECPVWHYYKILKEILNIILLKVLSTENVNFLRKLIEEHHILYKQLFSKTLKPKFHFLLHFISTILETGPVSHNWAMRFEGRNLESKVFAKLIRSRVNLCKSLAVRLMFQFGSSMIKLRTENSITDVNEVGPKVDNSYNWIIHKGTRYQLLDIVNVRDDSVMPTFYQITQINIMQDEVLLSLDLFETIEFNDHAGLYVIKTILNSNEMECNVNLVSAPLCTVYIGADTIAVNNFGI